MKKSELKTGMLVKRRDGEVRMVINDVLCSEGLYIDISSYNNDLTHPREDDFDLVLVSKQLKDNKLCPIYWIVKTVEQNILWERKETPEYTMEEAIEKMGHEFKIKK